MSSSRILQDRRAFGHGLYGIGELCLCTILLRVREFHQFCQKVRRNGAQCTTQRLGMTGRAKVEKLCQNPAAQSRYSRWPVAMLQHCYGCGRPRACTASCQKEEIQSYSTKGKKKGKRCNSTRGSISSRWEVAHLQKIFILVYMMRVIASRKSVFGYWEFIEYICAADIEASFPIGFGILDTLSVIELVTTG